MPPSDKNKNTKPFDPQTFRKGIAWVESRDGKDTWNDTSSATGRYQFLYNQIKDLPIMEGISREEFDRNLDLQEKVMDLAIEGNLYTTGSGYYKNAEDLVRDYKSKLGSKWNFRPDEVAALTHFLGRQGARRYFESLAKGKKYKPPGRNKTPEDYLADYNKGAGTPRGMQNKRVGARKNEDGSKSTHLMAREFVDDEITPGNPLGWTAFPTLRQENGQWIEEDTSKGWRGAYEGARERGEVRYFGNDEQAAIEYADQGNWKNSQDPRMQNQPVVDNTRVKPQSSIDFLSNYINTNKLAAGGSLVGPGDPRALTAKKRDGTTIGGVKPRINDVKNLSLEELEKQRRFQPINRATTGEEIMDFALGNTKEYLINPAKKALNKVLPEQLQFSPDLKTSSKYDNTPEVRPYLGDQSIADIRQANNVSFLQISENRNAGNAFIPEKLKNKVVNSINPQGYYPDINYEEEGLKRFEAIKRFMSDESDEKQVKRIPGKLGDNREDVFRMYAGLPQKYDTFTASSFKAGSDSDTNITFKDPEQVLDYVYIAAKKTDLFKKLANGEITPEAIKENNRVNKAHFRDPKNVMWNATFGIGFDDAGNPYLSFYDNWDLAGKDDVLGSKNTFGSPIEIYDRIPLTDALIKKMAKVGYSKDSDDASDGTKMPNEKQDKGEIEKLKKQLNLDAEIKKEINKLRQSLQNRYSNTDNIQSMGNNNKYGGKMKKYGGNLYEQGGSLDNANSFMTQFNTGGSHGQNPLGGIPQGMGSNGKPNLVEEGETKDNDQQYVFSDSLIISEDIANMFSLDKKAVGKSFADYHKIINKINEETPNDDLAKKTAKEMSERLTAAQEHERQKMGVAEGNEFKEGGGLFSKSQFGAGLQEGATGEQLGDTMGAGLGAVSALAQFGNMAFGSSGVDKSGATDVGTQNASSGGAAASGAMQGLQAGMAFGPWGAAIGGVLGAGAGLVSANKTNKDLGEARGRNNQMKNNQASQTDIQIAKYGGNLYAGGGYFEKRNPFLSMTVENQEPLERTPISGLSLGKYQNPLGDSLDTLKPFEQKESQQIMRDEVVNYFGRPTGFEQNKISGLNLGGNKSPFARQAELEKSQERAEKFPMLYGNGVQNSIDKANERLERRNNRSDNRNTMLPANIMRGAGLGMNLLQLLTLPKAEQERFQRVDGNYRPQFADERVPLNLADQAMNSAQRRAVMGNASQGQVMDRLMGAGAQSQLAKSMAYSDIAAQNRQEYTKGFDYKFRADNANSQIDMQEKITNAQNRGARETAKNQLMSSIAQNLMGMGTEEMRKNYPDLLELMYNWKGKYNKPETA